MWRIQDLGNGGKGLGHKKNYTLVSSISSSRQVVNTPFEKIFWTSVWYKNSFREIAGIEKCFLEKAEKKINLALRISVFGQNCD